LEGDAQLDCRCRALGCEQGGIHTKRKVFLVAGRCPATRMPRRRIVVGRRCPARSRSRFVWFLVWPPSVHKREGVYTKEMERWRERWRIRGIEGGSHRWP